MNKAFKAFTAFVAIVGWMYITFLIWDRGIGIENQLLSLGVSGLISYGYLNAWRETFSDEPCE